MLLNIDHKTLGAVKEALAEYVAEVEGSNRGRVSKESYIYHAEAFVRWVDGDFDPSKEYLQ